MSGKEVESLIKAKKGGKFSKTKIIGLKAQRPRAKASSEKNEPADDENDASSESEAEVVETPKPVKTTPTKRRAPVPDTSKVHLVTSASINTLHEFIHHFVEQGTQTFLLLEPTEVWDKDFPETIHFRIFSEHDLAAFVTADCKRFAVRSVSQTNVWPPDVVLQKHVRPVQNYDVLSFMHGTCEQADRFVPIVTDYVDFVCRLISNEVRRPDPAVVTSIPSDALEVLAPVRRLLKQGRSFPELDCLFLWFRKSSESSV